MAEYLEREELLRQLRLWHIHRNDEMPDYFHYTGIKAWIEALPAEDVQPVKWIPVTEKLPERFGAVIVCGKMKDSFEKDYYKFVDVAYFDKPEEEKDIDKWSTFNDWYEGQQEYAITYWMPLPEPPEDGEP